MTTLIETSPTMELRPHDIDNLIDELRACHAIDSPLFQRREQREWASTYLHGLLLDIPRKSIEPMVLAMQGDDAKPHTRHATVCRRRGVERSAYS